MTELRIGVLGAANIAPEALIRPARRVPDVASTGRPGSRTVARNRCPDQRSRKVESNARFASEVLPALRS
jgi:hypothetical protein